MSDVFKEQYSKLNSKQKEAVSTIEGPVMVIAGPGTGKTTILTLRIANILKETDTQPENILALTFTESAVFSMRQKLFEVVGSIAYRVNIFTFHGFCNYLIDQYPDAYAKIISAKPITESIQLNLIEQIIESNNFSLIRPIGDSTYYVAKIRSAISHLKKENINYSRYQKIIRNNLKIIKDDENSYNKKTGKLKVQFSNQVKKLERSLELAQVYKQYQKELKTRRFYDFDDMILETLSAFENNKDFLLEQQEKYQYLLADEHQDANQAQNQILEKLADFHEMPNLFVVGDEKQAIFRFQGASLENFLYFQNRFRGTKVIQLQDNYRSTQLILDSAFALISNNQTESNLNIELRSFQKDNQPISITQYQNFVAENFGVIEQIEKIIKIGVNPKSIAVIYRKNSDLFGLIKFFENKQIPFVVKSKQNILKSDDYFRLKTLLKAIIDPHQKEFIIPFLHLDFIDLDFIDVAELSKKINTGENLFKIIKKAKESEFNDLSKIKNLILTLEQFSRQSHHTNALQIFEKSINQFGFLKNILSSVNSIERIGILNKIYQEIKKNSKNYDVHNYTIKDFVDYLEILEKYNFDLETSLFNKGEGVALMTAHGSKGLEYDYVFIIHTNQKNWGQSTTKNYFDLPYSNFTKESDQSISDERRLFYVAITRAKKQIYISYSEFDQNSRQDLPSQFISELRSDLITFKKEESVGFDNIINQFNFTDSAKINIRDKKYLNQIFLERPMSVTALNNYLECPWHYFYSNLLRVPLETTESLAFGNAIHRTLSWYVNNLNKKPNLSEFKQKFGQNLSSQLIDLEMKKNILKEFEKIINSYYENFLLSLDKNKKYLTEYSINDVFVEIGSNLKLRLKGNLDRIDFETSNRVNVIDYKTSKPKTINEIRGLTKNSNGNYYRQLVFYKFLIDNHKDWQMQFAELIFVKPNDGGKYFSRKFDITNEEVQELKKEIIRVSNEILNLKFWDKKCDVPDCQFCRMRKYFN